MFALGLMGSPRKKGNSAYLLSAFLKALEAKGAVTHTVVVAEKQILPCIGCTYCEKHGRCFQQTDDMAKEMYGLLRRADIVVATTPMYFYSAPAQLKMVIDRTQTADAVRRNLRHLDNEAHDLVPQLPAEPARSPGREPGRLHALPGRHQREKPF